MKFRLYKREGNSRIPVSLMYFNKEYVTEKASQLTGQDGYKIWCQLYGLGREGNPSTLLVPANQGGIPVVIQAVSVEG